MRMIDQETECRIRVAAIEYAKRIIAANGGQWRETYCPGGVQDAISVCGGLYGHATFGPPCSRRTDQTDWQAAAIYILSHKLRNGQELKMPPRWFPPFHDAIVELVRIDQIKGEIIENNGWFIESMWGYEPRVKGGVYGREGTHVSETYDYKTCATLADWEGLLNYVRTSEQ